MQSFAERHPWIVLDRNAEFVRRFSNRKTAERTVITRGERANWSMMTPEGKHLSYQELVTKTVLSRVQ